VVEARIIGGQPHVAQLLSSRVLSA